MNPRRSENASKRVGTQLVLYVYKNTQTHTDDAPFVLLGPRGATALAMFGPV